MEGTNLLGVKNLACRIIHQGSLWIIEAKDLEIIAYGDSFEKAFKSFEEDIKFVWDEYALASDKDLSEGGQELKKKADAILFVLG